MDDALAPADAPRKRRLRFSLLNLVLMLAVVALALGMWRVRRQFEPLRLEIDRLDTELGRVPVSDPSRAHYRVALASRDVFHHVRMRVYVPPRTRVVAELSVEHQMPGRKRSSRGAMTLTPGKHSLDFEVLREPVGDVWRYLLSSLSSGGGHETDGPLPPWFADDGSPLGMTFNDGPTDGLADGEPYEVICRKAIRADGSEVEVVLTLTPTRHKEP